MCVNFAVAIFNRRRIAKSHLFHESFLYMQFRFSVCISFTSSQHLADAKQQAQHTLCPYTIECARARSRSLRPSERNRNQVKNHRTAAVETAAAEAVK